MLIAKNVIASSNSASISILPGAPLNAAVSQLSPTSVQLTWDASLSPPASIVSYEIYYKLKTSPTYPDTPQFTQTDSLSSYAQTITVAADTGYDFKIFAQAQSGLKSTENCASCETTNAICGNDILEPGEACEDENLNAKSCMDFDYDSGTLACSTTCSFDFSSCENEDEGGGEEGGGGGSGGGGQGIDVTPPDPGLVTSPAYANSAPILIQFSGGSDIGGSDFDHVSLYYKKDAGPWIDSGISSSNTTGDFKFYPEGNGTYQFDLKAYDQQGNSSPFPSQQNSGKAITLYDVNPPVFESLSLNPSSTPKKVILDYTEATDVGPAGLKQVELWYKKDTDGVWMDSGLSQQTSNGSFELPFSPEIGTYYFSLILEDQAGNQSPGPYAQLSVLVAPPSSKVILVDLPSPVSPSTFTNIKVTGDEIIAYKYKINESDYSDEIPLSQPLQLTSLSEGTYTLTVVAKDSSGQWQDESAAAIYTWTVNFSAPTLVISGPYPSTNLKENLAGEEIFYKLVYSNFDQILLTVDDIFLTPVGQAEGKILLSQVSNSTWIATITDLVGKGDIAIGVLPGTAVNLNGKTAAAVFSAPFSLSGNLGDLQQTDQIDLKKSAPIHPPAPERIPTAQELQQIASAAVDQKNENGANEAYSILFPDSFRELETRLKECRLAYPTINFNDVKADQDADGLSNRMECYAQTNPLSRDTDDDGCWDGDEVSLLGTNPLDSRDCPFSSEKKLVWLTSPQNEWTISQLQIAGLTPAETSRVDFFVFPVREGRSNVDQGVNVGQVADFSESSVQGHYFFDFEPEIGLKDGLKYDLVAVSTLRDGQTIASPAVRFILDKNKTAQAPIPISLQNQKIDRSLRLSDIQVYASKDGKLTVTGKSEYGAQVYVMWKSVVLASSIINDSDAGTFSLQSPMPLEPDQNHLLRLYAVKDEAGQKIRSPNVEVPFYLHGSDFFFTLFILLMIRIIPLFIILRLRKHYKKY